MVVDKVLTGTLGYHLDVLGRVFANWIVPDLIALEVLQQYHGATMLPQGPKLLN